MSVVQQIQTPKEFWDGIVVPDYNAFVAKTDDLRLAFHCAIALFHMADWVYVMHQSTINATFTFVDGAKGVRPVIRSGHFANSLGQAHPDFELVRQIANAAKHLDLDGKSHHANAPTHAANVFVRTMSWVSGGMGTGGLSAVALGQQPRVVLANHPGQPDIEFINIAKSVFAMWHNLNAKQGWW